MEPLTEPKRVEQLQIYDVIPAFGEDYEVRHVGPLAEHTGLGMGHRVTFKNSRWVIYQIGTMIDVLVKQ